ncbi:AsnC family protein [Salmonella enterica]|nr:AsnC family protein [Salmonella enterica]EKC3539660.1 AsnC family protein [Salmonella enterica]
MILKPMGTPGKCPAHFRPWTAEQEELLISLYPSMTYDQIASALNRSVAAIRLRVNLLHKSGRLAYKEPRITPEQLRFIRDNRHTMTIRGVAAVLGVSPRTVDNKIKDMGISYYKCGDRHPLTKYPDSDVDLIRQLRDESDLSFGKIAEKFDMPAKSCQSIYTSRLTVADAIAREYLPR